jgi:hypothetical protein
MKKVQLGRGKQNEGHWSNGTGLRLVRRLTGLIARRLRPCIERADSSLSIKDNHPRISHNLSEVANIRFKLTEDTAMLCEVCDLLLDRNYTASSQYFQATQKLLRLVGEGRNGEFMQAMRECHVRMQDCRQSIVALQEHQASHRAQALSTIGVLRRAVS